MQARWRRVPRPLRPGLPSTPEEPANAGVIGLSTVN
jgi:hypothetical protein